MTATGAPSGTVSSAVLKYRPIAGGASKKPKTLAVTAATFISRASSPLPTGILSSMNAPRRSNDFVQRVKSA